MIALLVMLAVPPPPPVVPPVRVTSIDGGSVIPVSGTFSGTATVSGGVYVLDAGTLNVNLPTGAATSAKQDTGNTSLSSIDTKTPALVSGRQPVDPSGVTSPISAATLPLPSGASTEATLALIKAKTDNIDVALSTRTKPADQQHVIVDTAPTTAVTAAALPLPSGAATDATLSQLLDGGTVQLGRQADGAARAIAVTDFGVQWVVPLPVPLPSRGGLSSLPCNAVRRTNCR